MIDERQQELASLYVLDLLEGTERVEFETALAGSPELQTLVAELRQAATNMAHAAPAAQPPVALKDRILASIAQQPTGESAPVGPVVAFPRATGWSVFAPWALAAGFALCTAWLGARYYLAKIENARLADSSALAEVALRSAQTQLEAERLMSARVATDLNHVKLTSEQQVAEARQSISVLQKQVADARQAQSASEKQLADLRQSQSSLTDQLTAAEKAETQARAQVVALTDRLERERDLARLKVATLASMLNNSPQALAVAVWDPNQKEGVFTVDKLPANAPDQRYELWVIDEKPVSAGTFSVGADGRVKLTFKPTAPVKTALKFAVSREKNDGRSSHATPGEVIMISQ